MRGELLADILLILIVSSVIAVILCLVNRGKRTTKKTMAETATKSTDDNQG